MSTMSDAEVLGHHLWNFGFHPVPDIDDDGRLLGVRLWRQRDGFVEFVAPRMSGASNAGRVVADFSFRDPFHHGRLVDFRRGDALNVLYWLLSEERTC